MQFCCLGKAGSISFRPTKVGVILSRKKVWLTTALITAGVVGAAIFNWPRSNDATTRDSPIELEADNNVLQLRKGKPLAGETAEPADRQVEGDQILVDLGIDHVERGDQYLLVGNYDGAHREYVKATGDFRAELPAALLLRLAMTAEQLGETEESDLLYQRAVRQSSDGSVTRILGLAGLARVWQSKGQLNQAHELLSELFLRYASLEMLPDEVRFQLVYQLGAVIQQKCFAILGEPQSEMDSLEYLWLGPDIDAAIDMLRQHGDVALVTAPSDAPTDQFLLLQRPSPDVRLIAVDSSVSLMLIEDILNQYSQLAGIKFEPSKLAMGVIEGRSSRLAVSGLPLALVLDHMLSPLGLVWTQNGETIRIHQEKEPDVDHRKYLAELADRALRNIELSFPRETRRDTSLLHRGNLSFLTGDVDAAVVRYSELEKLIPNGELAAKLGFNAAIIEITNGNMESAVKRLFFAVDQTLDQALQAKSYAWIGRIELQLGRPNRAVYALSRGLSLAQDSQVRQDVTMNLAKAYLLESDPFSANRILFNNADAVIDTSERKKAAVFAAYARYLGSVPGEGLRNESERMVVALASIAPDDARDFVDQLLIGRAFFEVGFGSRSTEFLKLALESAPHAHWRRRVAFELAINQYRSGELSEAAKHFQTLLEGVPDATSILARLKLAEIALTQKNPEQCLEHCQQIWQQNITNEQKMETLSMMGLAYQRLGRHEIAAVCFSGMVPYENQLDSSINKSDPAFQAQ